MNEVININENNIKFKGSQFYVNNPEQVRLWAAFMKLKAITPKVLIHLKRVRDALHQEGLLLDEVVKELRDSYIQEVNGQQVLPEPGTNEFIELDNKILALIETEILIPLPKIKFSQISGIESVAELDALDGIIELDEV